MKKIKFLIVIVVILLCSGCKATYKLDYYDDTFKEELVVEELSQQDQTYFDRYNDEASLVIDDNNSYKYTNGNNKKIFSYTIGKSLKNTPLLDYCFENVYVIDTEKYVNIKTDGEFYCKNYDITLKLNTDKKVINSNASSSVDGTYTWDELEDGITVQISKEELLLDSNNVVKKNLKDLYIRLAIVIGFIVIIVFAIIRLKKNHNKD